MKSTSNIKKFGFYPAKQDLQHFDCVILVIKNLFGVYTPCVHLFIYL